jgi:hypothetical protein
VHFDIVKAGLAGRTPVDLNISIQMIAFHALGSSPGMGQTMLSDQALKQGRLEDALACAGDEGRSKLR